VTTADALRRAIIENPEDIAPRLALADLLEESGNEVGAAYIRVKGTIVYCRRAYGRWSSFWMDGPGYARDELDHPLPIPSWEFASRALPVGVRRELDEIVIRHGFVEEVTASMAGFMRVAINGRLFAGHPVREVRIRDRRPYNDDGDPPQHYWQATLMPTGDVPWGTESLPLSVCNMLSQRNGAYLTVEAAHADLSAACVRYGRLRAGKERG
jgi:uncharacterized protein (TIGR02996 family)